MLANVLIESFRTKHYNFHRNSDYTAKKKQKVVTEECNKICIIHFSSSSEQNFVDMLQAADKDKKFEKIKQIACKRLNKSDGSSYKSSEKCANITTMATIGTARCWDNGKTFIFWIWRWRHYSRNSHKERTLWTANENKGYWIIQQRGYVSCQ